MGDLFPRLFNTIATAAPPVGKDGQIHACYWVKAKSEGKLRVIDSLCTQTSSLTGGINSLGLGVSGSIDTRARSVGAQVVLVLRLVR
jgi:hypothetical protein